MWSFTVGHTDLLVVGIMAAIPAFIAAFASWRQAVYNSKKIQEIHLTVNGRLMELLALTKTAAHAAGLQEGKHQR
jgi:hypothetical protein